VKLTLDLKKSIIIFIESMQRSNESLLLFAQKETCKLKVRDLLVTDLGEVVIFL
jgi:hypothetical protein